MGGEFGEDISFAALRRLKVLEPDKARSERVRTRCHSVLAHDGRTAGRNQLIEGWVVGALCLLYAVSMASAALALYFPR